MIIDVWSWPFAPGSGHKAMDFLKRVAQHHTSQGIISRLLSPSNGFLNKVFFESEYESLAAMEKYMNSFFKSDAWKDFDSEEWGDLFVIDRLERYQLTVVE